MGPCVEVWTVSDYVAVAAVAVNPDLVCGVAPEALVEVPDVSSVTCVGVLKCDCDCLPFECAFRLAGAECDAFVECHVMFGGESAAELWLLGPCVIVVGSCPCVDFCGDDRPCVCHDSSGATLAGPDWSDCAVTVLVCTGDICVSAVPVVDCRPSSGIVHELVFVDVLDSAGEHCTADVDGSPCDVRTDCA